MIGINVRSFFFYLSKDPHCRVLWDYETVNKLNVCFELHTAIFEDYVWWCDN